MGAVLEGFLKEQDKTKWHEGLAHLGSLGRGGVLAGLLGGRNLFEALLFRLLVLGLVLHQHLEELGGLVLVQGLGELVDTGGHLQPLDKDLYMPKGGGNRPKSRVSDLPSNIKSFVSSDACFFLSPAFHCGSTYRLTDRRTERPMPNYMLELSANK